MINISLLFPDMAAQHSRREPLREKVLKQESRRHEERHADDWFYDSLSTSEKSQAVETPCKSREESVRRPRGSIPASRYASADNSKPAPADPVAAPVPPARAFRTDSDIRPGPDGTQSYSRLNAAPVTRQPASSPFRKIDYYRAAAVGTNRVEAYVKSVRPGKRSAVDISVSTKSKFLTKGRTDPTATFQNVPLSAASEIDSKKAQQSNTESPEIRALLDDWEQRTGKIAPSRRK